MTTEIDDLYQELIIDHAKKPKNYGTLKERSHYATGHNPLCGDIIDIELDVDKDIIKQIAFHGNGCAISQASASLMTEVIKGKTVEVASQIFADFHALLTENSDDKNLGKLLVLKGVRKFPVRVKCATLCWHTLNAALERTTQDVTTE